MSVKYAAIVNKKERSKMKRIKIRTIFIFIIGLVIARASFLGINPLAIGYFMAAYLERVNPGLLLITILVGAGSVMPPTMMLKYLLTMISSLVLLESPLIKKRELATKIYFYIPAVSLGIFAMMDVAASGWKADFAVMAVLESIIAFVSGIIFSMGIGFIMKHPKGAKMSNEEMISLSLMVAVVIYGMPNIGNAYIAPLETIEIGRASCRERV